MNKDFLKQLNILYVEDQDEIRNFTSNILNNFVNKLIVCNNGEEGLITFKENQDVNLIITDINMPKMNGLEMISQINKINPNIPTITTTAHTDSNFYKKSIDLGITSYCLKPLDLYELIKNITKLLEHKFLAEKLNNEIDLSNSSDTMELLNKQDSFVAIFKKDKQFLSNELFSKTFKNLEINLEDSLIDKEQYSQEDKTPWLEYIANLEDQSTLINLKIDDLNKIFKIDVSKLKNEEDAYVVSLFDVTNLNEKSNLFEYKYNHDLITGLYNLNKFHKIFSIESKRVRRYRKSLSIIKLAIENIDEKITYEELMNDITELINKNVREHDINFKVEESSFLILLPETDLDGALNVAYKLEELLNDMLESKGTNKKSCFGVVELNNDDNEDLFLKRVSSALKKALNNEDERVSYF
ncbi:response regulator [Arcobacter sp.]|uniref:response regulator n=1 Tax=Arcobacter sp. TaxID=1872629 RepID=UPI003D14C42B